MHSQNWDIDQYKTEHECDEHWELRRSFLLAHKDKFPEDELVCLAQVFTNVELLGCRYPKETMQLIEELTKDVAKDYRERQKSKLQRTFVKASDAASSKAKGQRTGPADSSSSETSSVLSKTSNNSTAVSVSSTTHKTSNNITILPTSLESESDHRKTSSTQFSRSVSQSFCRGSSDEMPSSKRMRVENHSKFGNMVVVEHPGESPQSILACTANMIGASLEWKFDRSNENMFKCVVSLNTHQLSEVWAANRKLAKKEASVLALKELQKYHYTIRIKPRSSEPANVTTSTMSSNKPSQEGVSDDNIGKKLMKLMGWTGGGLGKSQQGIVEPVVVKQQISREGLGLKLEKNSMTELKLKTKNILKKYMMDGMKTDLVFSTDFTNEERAVIHQIARQMNLKSHSYGPKNARSLVVSRKVDIKDLVVELKNLGGSTDKYELVEPTNE